MNLFSRLYQRLTSSLSSEEQTGAANSIRYRRPWKTIVLLNMIICIMPLIIMTGINYFQYQKTLRQELTEPVYHLTYNTKRNLEFFLEERRAVLNFLVDQMDFKELSKQQELAEISRHLKDVYRGFVDIGLIDSLGKQLSYVGPYSLLEMNYSDTDWFHEVNLRGVHVSDMFKGYRNYPHFVIAVRHEMDNGDFYVLRATIDMSLLNRQMPSIAPKSSSDVFLINQDGVLQTPSRFYGDVMESCPLSIDNPSRGTGGGETNRSERDVLCCVLFPNQGISVYSGFHERPVGVKPELV